MNFRAMRFTGILVATIVVVAACSSSSSDPAPGGTSPPINGITRTGIVFAIGPITDFGSVVVNGIAYDTSSTDFTVDGQTGTQSDLKIGQVVIVKGTIDDDNTNAAATFVEYEDLIEGPVTAIVDDVTIVILGSQIVHTGGAISDNSCAAQPLTSFASVEISGTVRGDGSIDATFIDCKTVLDGDFELNGIAMSVGNDTFLINQVVVNYTDAPAVLDNFPNSGVINDGDPVEVKGIDINANDEFVATRVEFKGDRLAGDDGDHFEVEGFITNFSSASRFDIGPFHITTSGSTTYEGGSDGDLGPNIKVEVEGERNGASIEATKVQFRRGTAVRMEGLVDMKDAGDANAFYMLGVRVATNGNQTRFDDKTGVVADGEFDATDIVAGNFVGVRGQEFPAGSNELAAVIVERDDTNGFAPDENILQGFVQDATITRPSLSVLGVTIMTGAGTQYRDQNDNPVGENTFWDTLVQPGSLVKAKGTISGPLGETTLDAVELELQVE